MNRLMEENEKLRGLLREVRVLLANSSYKISGTAAFLSSIDAALSRQADPTDTYTAVDMATAAAQGFRDGQAAVEPAPAQDEREAFEAWLPRPWSSDTRFDEEGELVYAEDWVQGAWIGWQAARATRHAQTEQQPLFVPEGWLIELGFDVLDRPFRFVDSKSHTPTIKVILPACEPVDSSSWDLRDEIARRIGSVLAAPIAQTAKGGE